MHMEDNSLPGTGFSCVSTIMSARYCTPSNRRVAHIPDTSCSHNITQQSYPRHIHEYISHKLVPLFFHKRLNTFPYIDSIIFLPSRHIRQCAGVPCVRVCFLFNLFIYSVCQMCLLCSYVYEYFVCVFLCY